MFEESKSFPSDAPAAPWPEVTEQGSIVGAKARTVWLQLAIVFGLLEAALWTRPGALEIIWIASVALCVLLSTRASAFSAKTMGLALPSLAVSWPIVLGGIVLAATMILSSMVMGLAGTAHALPLLQAIPYALWALIQQFILQSFFFVRLESVLGGRRAVVAAAILFGAVHIPNPVLTVASVLGGLFFCEMFRRSRNIFPLGMVHAILGLMIAASFSDVVLRHMRVGEGYLSFHQ